MAKTEDERKRSKIAGIVFSDCQILDFACVRKNIGQRRKVLRYNREIKTLKDLATKYGVTTPEIEALKAKDTISI